MVNQEASEYYQYYPPYDVIISTNGMAITASNALQQGLGTYIDKIGGTLYFYSGGKCLLNVETSDKDDVINAVRAFTTYNGQTDDIVRMQLQALVNQYIRAA